MSWPKWKSFQSKSGIHFLNSKLSSVALKYLAISATSFPSERVFSGADGIINKLRSSMAPKRAEKLVISTSSDSVMVFDE